MITLEHVKKSFNKSKKNEIKAINDTSLKIENTGLVALLGASGSGKTTLLNMIGGLDKPNKGKIFINNERITKRRTSKIDKIRNLNIGYIFQDYKLIDNLSVYDNVAIVLKMIGLKNKEEIKKRVNYVLETLNIYRFRNRPAGMLSGGERQRVGIARAIVKDPDIIIADEPTGNLDSKNSLELMNIIKCIAKTRSVILVTHEVNLAKFFASRIIEIEDGKVVNDYQNTNSEKLDYRLENNIYLKDIKHHEVYDNNNNKISLYNESKEDVNLTIVVRNGNIYIKSEDNLKLEVIDQNSSLELIDDHYKKLDQEEISKYEFNFSKIINNNYKKKYSSIFNVFTLLISGFKKIFSYSFMKKILLLGFMAASMFIVFSLSRIAASFHINDSDFVTLNKSYIKIQKNNFTEDDYFKIKALANINYVMPKDSLITFYISYNTYLQNYGNSEQLSGSLSGIKLINKDDLLYGNMPNSVNEIVVDKAALKPLFEENHSPQQAGILDYSSIINHNVMLKNLNEFKIVGITDLGSPSIYADESMLVNMLANTYSDLYNGEETKYLDYLLKQDEFKLKKGSWPLNDYEVALNYELKDQYTLNKTIDSKINGHKLKVVGFYESNQEGEVMLINNNTVIYNMLNNKSLMVSSNNKSDAINELNKLGYNAKDAYESAKEAYQNSKQESVNTTVIISSIIIAISLIEIYLMIRSSFLSRIKEIGTLRAIGVKKGDIYKMFLGEILAISILASTAGIALMSYVLYNVTKMPYIGNSFIINSQIVIISFGICFAFNILVGLIPVANVIRKTPAAILARHDI